jgi:SAM-dependent methyltransferase
MRRTSPALNFTGYVYGGLSHSTHIQYDESAESKGEGSVRRGLDRMGLGPDAIKGARVMDVGTGLYSLGFARLGAIVEHRDVSVRTIDALNRYARERGYTTLTSSRTDLCVDPLPEAHFDLIYLSGIFQHFSAPDRALANLARALKPGGWLYLDIYRSGCWRWFVVDMLRHVTRDDLLSDVLARFADLCTLGDRHAFHLRQVELLVDDLFVEHVHLFHPDDVRADATALGLEVVKPVTSMGLVDPGTTVDHSRFFAHVFNTLVLQRTGGGSSTVGGPRTDAGRCQLTELAAAPEGAALADLTADFLLAHRSGRFAREETISHVVNLFRMAHPCLQSDPYFVEGVKESRNASAVQGTPAARDARYQHWAAFLARALGVPSPLPLPQLESFGYEFIRHMPAD